MVADSASSSSYPAKTVVVKVWALLALVVRWWDLRSCLWRTIRGGAAGAAASPSGPARSTWTAQSEAECATEEEGEE